MGDKPESILVTTFNVSDTTDPVTNWQQLLGREDGTIDVVLSPRYKWEGALQHLSNSQSGIAEKLLHELRDPYILVDRDEESGEDRPFMYYVGGGENGIGVVRLDLICV